MGDFVLVVREDEIDRPTMEIEGLDAEALPDLCQRHRGALEVPARTAAAEGGIPGRADLFVHGVGLLPEGEVARIVLGILITRHPRPDLELAAVEL